MKNIPSLNSLVIFLFLSLNLNAQYYSEPLWIMDTLSGTNFDLTFKQGVWDFYPDGNTETYAYNGNLLGPTLIMQRGDTVHMKVSNSTDDTTSVHWHGLHVPANVDGTHYNKILPGETWEPSFKVDNKAATYWYHPHIYKKTNLHVTKGACGLLIIRDSEESGKSLPRTYGVDDIPIVVQSRIINPEDGQIILEGMTGSMDTTLTVNGVVRPYVEVPAQPVRFRMLNGATARIFMHGFSNNMDFYQVATDGSLTESPREMNRIRLSNGERTEIVVDFTGMQDSILYLMSYGTELGQYVPGGGIINGVPNPYDSADFSLMQLRIVAPSNPVSFDPEQILTTIEPISLTEVDTTREVVFVWNGLNAEYPNVFDDQPFMHDFINHRIPIGNTEIWELRNTQLFGHPFHIHDVQFQIMDKEDGQSVPEFEQGWKDVVFVEGESTTRFITRFTDFADTSAAYMYHCHNLVHEDMGMMGQFVVYDTTSIVGLRENVNPLKFSIDPNPSADMVYVQFLEPISGGQITVCSLSGKVLISRKIDSQTTSSHLDIHSLEEGLYIIHISDKFGRAYSDKLVKKY